MQDDVLRALASSTWEEAKGKLRALLAVAGCAGGGAAAERRYDDFCQLVEGFISDVESRGFHRVSASP